MITWVVEIGLALICASLPSLRVYNRYIRKLYRRIRTRLSHNRLFESVPQKPNVSSRDTINSPVPKSLESRYIGIAEETIASRDGEIILRDVEAFPRTGRKSDAVRYGSGLTSDAAKPGAVSVLRTL